MALLGFVLCVVGLGAAVLDCSAAGAQVKRVSSLTGTIRYHRELHSAILGNDRNLTVYLPPDYEKQSSRHYPVLYMHDGQNVFDGMTSYLPNVEWRADEAAEALIQARLIEPLIIVAVDNGGATRADEYLPTKMKREDGQMWGGNADAYGRMLVEEVKPLIDRTYRTLGDGAHTGLCGSSFGGIATIYLGLRHPETFSRLIVASPSFWWDDNVMLKQIQALPRKLPLKIWMDVGTAEGVEMVASFQAVAKALEAKGWKPGKDLVEYVDGHAEHNEAAWSRRFPAALMFLFPARRQ